MADTSTEEDSHSMNEQFLQRIKHCPTLPSLPAIAIQILELTQREDVDIAEIARIISKDPALSTKILRTVNSSFYGRSQNVSTVSHALVILGLQSVKTLVLGFSLVSNLMKKGKGDEKSFNHLDYWRRSIYSATAARTLAARLSIVQQEEAFLAALLKDIGMLVLDQVLGPQYGEMTAKAATHAQLPAIEREALGADHAEVAGYLAAQWKLPPVLTVPISFHHAPAGVTDASLKKLAEVVYLSGLCADVFVEQQPAPAIAQVREFCGAQYKMSETDCDALLEEIGTRTREAATLFEINIGAAANYEAILKKANEALVEITLQSQQHASTLQQQASTLVEQNQQLKKRAMTDALTGLANRAHFDQFLAEQLQAAAESRKPMSLLLLDVDKFKSVNDRYGHPAGDRVLQALGQKFAAAARAQDLAARYGGEELCLILPSTGRAAAAAIAENIRRSIAAKPIVCGAMAIPLTASIGVATFEPGGTLKSAVHLLKAADLAVYNAKHSGRNCVRVFTLPTAAPAKPPAAA
ncbi:MAG TPA: GGDEF domain-containing protein [Tepidisphaeraceae bacterium]|nr:GGDEF domain-containing protein [Tepidisphaeraceae bacterium]